jgi:hypothetical protein
MRLSLKEAERTLSQHEIADNLTKWTKGYVDAKLL